jgi:protein-tyrosine-phosphatase/N-acetylglutamate synthase-like GNAT family acetyltransferase
MTLSSSASPPRVRLATPADLRAIESLLVSADLPVAGVAEALEQFAVMDAGGRIVGAAGLERAGPDALLRSVVVAPERRGSGLGERLTAHQLAAARHAGLGTLWLLTTTAEPFFHRFGFRPVPRTAAPAGISATGEFQAGHCASAVAMARRAQALRVMVICTANVARSQLAEALFAHLGGDLIAASSAGVAPGRGPHDFAVEVLADRGIAWRGKRSKSLAEFRDAGTDLVITVCDEAREACPVIPGAVMAHWGLADPTFAPGGSASRRAAFRAAARDLEARIRDFLQLPFATMDARQLAQAADEIHRRHAATS